MVDEKKTIFGDFDDENFNGCTSWKFRGLSYTINDIYSFQYFENITPHEL